MSVFQLVVILVAIVFIFFGIDLFKRKKMNILHFLVFFTGGLVVVVFAIDVNLLNKFWKFFGAARGADIVVFVALIFLMYLYIDGLNKQTKDKYQLTKLVSETAIQVTYEKERGRIHQWMNSEEKDKYIFNVRAYNEASYVGQTIDEIIQHGFRKILVINDGSTDTTKEIVLEKQKQYPDKLILLLSHTINRGGWAANQTWFNFIKRYYTELKVEWIVTYDADGQMNINDMDTFMHAIKHHRKEVYLGSRFIDHARVENMPPIRRVILFISKLITLVFYGARVSDPHNGFRVISTNALQHINLTADGMHYANELQEQIRKNKLSVMEIPVHIKYTEYSMNKEHRQKNSNSLRLAAEMIYKKLFFR